MRAVGMLLPLAGAIACASGDGRDSNSDGGASFGSNASGIDDGGGTADVEGSTGHDPFDEEDSADSGLGFDVAAGDEASPCEVDDMCCLMEGDIPPHVVLDAFLDAYPPANMPKTQAELMAFDPMAGGYTITWHDAASGGEFVDAREGGVLQANVEAGRAQSRTQAEMVMPGGSMVLDVREDPWLTDNPDGMPTCVASDGTLGTAGIGWAWGSIIFRTPDDAVREIVYLYIGYCVGDKDSEAFYYSDEPVLLCEPPG